MIFRIPVGGPVAIAHLRPREFEFTGGEMFHAGIGRGGRGRRRGPGPENLYAQCGKSAAMAKPAVKAAATIKAPNLFFMQLLPYA